MMTWRGGDYSSLPNCGTCDRLCERRRKGASSWSRKRTSC
jgi:hypothetical protein